MRAAQRKNKQKRIGLRRYFLIWISAVVGFFVLTYAVVWGWYCLQRPAAFPVSQVIVEGEAQHVSNQYVVDVARDSLRGSFFSLDLEGYKRQLLINPWLESVSFRRVWPNTLIVMLQEKNAVARWQESGVVSDQAMIFYPDKKTIDVTLPQLFGPVEQLPLIMQTMASVDQLLRPLSLKVKILRESSPQSWSVVFSDGVEVIFDHEQIMSQLGRLLTVYKKLVDKAPHPIARIDSRYSNGFAIKYKS